MCCRRSAGPARSHDTRGCGRGCGRGTVTTGGSRHRPHEHGPRSAGPGQHRQVRSNTGSGPRRGEDGRVQQEQGVVKTKTETEREYETITGGDQRLKEDKIEGQDPIPDQPPPPYSAEAPARGNVSESIPRRHARPAASAVVTSGFGQPPTAVRRRSEMVERDIPQLNETNASYPRGEWGARPKAKQGTMQLIKDLHRKKDDLRREVRRELRVCMGQFQGRARELFDS